MIAALVARSIPTAIFCLVAPTVIIRFVARRKVMIVSSDGIHLGSKFYPISEIDRVETYQHRGTGQGNCHVVLRLVDGRTVNWWWINYMRSMFGIMMADDHLTFSTQRYLQRLGSALTAAKIEHSFIGANSSQAKNPAGG